MALADGGAQEARGRELAVLGDPQVPAGDQEMGLDRTRWRSRSPQDGDQEESQLAVIDAPAVGGGGEAMPDHLSIGTRNAWKKEQRLPVPEGTNGFGDHLCVQEGQPVGS